MYICDLFLLNSFLTDLFLLLYFYNLILHLWITSSSYTCYQNLSLKYFGDNSRVSGIFSCGECWKPGFHITFKNIVNHIHNHQTIKDKYFGKGRPIHLCIHLWCLFIHYDRGWSGCTRSNYSFVSIYVIIQLWWHLRGHVAPSIVGPS